MTPPRCLWRVEWDAARHPDRPHERRRVVRHFTSLEAVERQVKAVRAWPEFMDLDGIWVADGLEWKAVECPS